MKIFLLVIIFVGVVLGGLAFMYYPTLYGIIPDNSSTPRLSDVATSSPAALNPTNPDYPAELIITEGLDTPWGIAFLPDGNMLVTERKGTVRLVEKNGNLRESPVATIPNVKEMGEGGLLGITLHPQFNSNKLVYLYYTYGASGNNTLNRVVRMKYNNGQLVEEQTIVDEIPGASNHNGGRIKFGPDNYLYITTGDAQEPSRSQDNNSPAGKILRVTDQGKAAPGNPFNNLVYSWGHRNPQGIAWDQSGKLWESEHGPSGGSLGTGNDEVNLITSGGNFGWPEIQGDQKKEGMITPVKFSTPSIAWAPGGTAILNNQLFFSGLRGQALYRADISGGNLVDLTELFKGKYGRIREVIVGPDKMLYITTSNKDGRGVPGDSDDRIIRINPSKI